MKPELPPEALYTFRHPNLGMTTIKVIKLKARDRTTLKATAATYGVTDPIDFCHSIIIPKTRASKMSCND
jgi:hypothetical protein